MGTRVSNASRTTGFLRFISFANVMRTRERNASRNSGFFILLSTSFPVVAVVVRKSSRGNSTTNLSKTSSKSNPFIFNVLSSTITALHTPLHSSHWRLDNRDLILPSFSLIRADKADFSSFFSSYRPPSSFTSMDEDSDLSSFESDKLPMCFTSTGRGESSSLSNCAKWSLQSIRRICRCSEPNSLRTSGKTLSLRTR